MIKGRVMKRILPSRSKILSVAIATLVSGGVAAEGLNQSGFNVGVTAGGTLGQSNFDLNNWEGSSEGKHDVSEWAFLGGAQLGYRYFLNNGLMLGIEADYQRSSYDVTDEDQPYNDADIGQEISDIVTARIKAGKLINDNTLAYITGGYAYTRGDVLLKDETGHTDNTDGIDSHGWVAGLGVEHSINKNLSIKGEYLYLKTYGKADTYYTFEGEGYHSDVDFIANIFRIGINYNF